MCKVNTVFTRDSVEISRVCSVTKEKYTVIVPNSRYQEWRTGALIQNVFPELSSDEREFLISGTTPAEWNKLFGE